MKSLGLSIMSGMGLSALFHVGDIIIEVLRKFGESAKNVHLRERNIRKTDNPYGNGTTE